MGLAKGPCETKVRYFEVAIVTYWMRFESCQDEYKVGIRNSIEDGIAKWEQTLGGGSRRMKNKHTNQDIGTLDISMDDHMAM